MPVADRSDATRTRPACDPAMRWLGSLRPWASPDTRMTVTWARLRQVWLSHLPRCCPGRAVAIAQAVPGRAQAAQITPFGRGTGGHAGDMVAIHIGSRAATVTSDRHAARLVSGAR